MRRKLESTLTCPLNARERSAVDEMKIKLGVASDSNFTRWALYRAAVFLDNRTDTRLFRLRGQARRRQLSS